MQPNIIQMLSDRELYVQAGAVFGRSRLGNRNSIRGVVVYDKPNPEGGPVMPIGRNGNINFFLPTGFCAVVRVNDVQVLVHEALASTPSPEFIQARGMLDFRLFGSKDLNNHLCKRRDIFRTLGITVR